MTISNDFAHDVIGEFGRRLGYLGKREDGLWVFIEYAGIIGLTAQDSSIITNALFKANGIVIVDEEVAG